MADDNKPEAAAAEAAKAEVTHIEGKDLHAAIKERLGVEFTKVPGGGYKQEIVDAHLAEFDKHADALGKEVAGKKFTSEQVDEMTKGYFDHIKPQIGVAEGRAEQAKAGVDKITAYAKGNGIASEAAKAAEKTAEKAGFFAKNFSKDIKGNWKGSGTGIKFARGAGTTVGVALVGMGGRDIISKDEDGQRHVVSGIVKTGVGAAAIAASLLAKGKGASASV